MNFFAEELKKIMSCSKYSAMTSYISNAAFIRLDEELRAKIVCTHTQIYEQNDAVMLSIISRTHGEIDRLTVKFSDVWGMKHGYINDFAPYIYSSTSMGNEADWYGYKPAPSDYEALAAEIDKYMSIFEKTAVFNS